MVAGQKLVGTIIGGVIALMFLFLSMPTVISGLTSALDAVSNATGLSEGEATLITNALILLLVIFLLTIVFAVYVRMTNDVE